MRNPVLCCIVFMLASAGYAETVREISLLSGWKFHKGDNIEWKNPEYDDSDWMNIIPTGYWGYLPGMEHYDGYGWYRMHVYIPSELKSGASDSDSLHIRLGRVDDNDQTFMNGVLIGENARNASGEGDPAFAGEEGSYALNRNYTLPLSHPLIQWDAINVIAVRAYDFYLTGGLTLDDHRLYAEKGWTDYVRLDRKTPYLSNMRVGQPFVVEFTADNHSGDLEFHTDFFAEVRMKETNEPVATFCDELVLPPGRSVETNIEFIPYIQTDYEISYRLTDQQTGQTLVKTNRLGLFLPDVDLLNQPIQPVIPDKIKEPYQSLPFTDVRIKGMLADKMQVNLENGLLNIPFQLVAPYLDDFAPPWPVGEFLGKLLHGNTKMLQYCRDERLLETTTGVIKIWLDARDEDGYLGTQPPELRWKGWDVWDHKYLMLALVHYYAITGFQPALDAAVEIGDLVSESFGYDEGQLDLVDGYHAGMAPGSILEPMVYLYKYTGNEKYLEFCHYILHAYEQENGPKIVSELTDGSQKVVNVGNGKAYEMLSCIIGLVQLYKVTGEEKLLNAAVNAWDDIQKNRLYITGTSAVHEHFQEAGLFPADQNDNPGESCVTAHWMYLSKELFKLLGDPKYMDEIDKSLYNHLLAAQHPVSGDVVYYSGYQYEKWYMQPDMYLGPPLCCHMSVKRCITEIPELSYYRSDDELGLLLYNSSQVNTLIKRVPVQLKLESDYPLAGSAKLEVDPDAKAEFTLALRVPDWCSNYAAKIGDQIYNGVPGQFLRIPRLWKSGDAVDIRMHFPLVVLKGGKSYPNHRALKYGNQVLTADAHVNGLNNPDDLVFDAKVDPQLDVYTGEMPENWVGDQAFVSNAVKTPDGEKIILVPYADAGQTGGDIRVWIKMKE